MINVDELAQEIRRVDGNHSLGAGALAEALVPFLTAALSHSPVEPGDPAPENPLLASRNNDETGECEPVEIEPVKVRELREKMAAPRDWDAVTIGGILKHPPKTPLQGWTKVTPDLPFEVLKSITKDNQVLAFERGRYFNAWLTFDEYEGGWCWVDDSDSEPSPSHYRPLIEVALATEGSAE